MSATTEKDLQTIAPYSEGDFEKMGVLAAWEKYGNVLTWGRGQCLAILDDGCKLTTGPWKVKMPWGPKVVATYNSIDRNEDCAPVPPGYHGTDIGYPSSINYGEKRGIAYNDSVAHVRCVSIVHLPGDESATMSDALQWVLDNREKYHITAVNLSPLDNKPHQKPMASSLDEPLKKLRELGVWVSSPCGNHGLTNGVSWPAAAVDCFAIGAVSPKTGLPHLNRYRNTDILAPATATSSANAYLAASAMVLREAIEKADYDWKKDGPNLADATLEIFKQTGVKVEDAATGLTFRQLHLLNALDHVFANGRRKVL